MDERRQGWKIVQVGVEGLLASAVFLSHFSVQVLEFGCLCWVFGFGALSLGLGCVGFIIDGWQPATNSEALRMRNW